MTLWLIVRKSLRQHALSTGITAVSIALATGLLMSIVSVKEQSMRAFTSVNGGFDAVMGSRGSELSLVLFSVFHMDQAPGTLLWEEYEFITGKANRRFIQRAVPIVVGDNYRDFRIVGTTAEFFEVPYANDRKHTLTTGGRIFHEDAQEAVVGGHVAQKLGLRVGDIIQPYHGLSFDPTQKHDVDYLIVGILQPSNTPTDHAIWIPLSGAQNMPGHSAEKATDISAILLQFNARSQAPQFAEMVNKNTRDKTVAVIAPTVSRFFSRFQWLGTVLGGMAGLVALVGAGGILASLYNTMNERRREVAILRALGARRGTVFGVILAESATISALGVVIGFALYYLFTGVAAWYLWDSTGVVIDPWAFHPILYVAPVCIIAMGTLAGILPAVKAYRTDVAANLIPQT
ncbi:MAG TPA: hypothetical protein DGP39_11230 [Verrucomicrobiales bacterium]|nr:hypothetical protein [Verrucomicrobiales bacterium]